MAFPRISLAEVLVAAAVFCGFLAGLRFAGDWAAQVAVLVAALAFLYALMAAIFDRGSARAAGAGFAIGAALYGAMFVAAGWETDTDALGFGGQASHEELGFYDAALPTTNLSQSLYFVLAVAEWEQTDTGETMRITQDSDGTLYDPWGRVFDPNSPAVPNTWRQTGISPDRKLPRLRPRGLGAPVRLRRVAVREGRLRPGQESRGCRSGAAGT